MKVGMGMMVGCLVAAITSLCFVGVLSTKETKTSPVGKWEIVKMEFTGKPDNKFTGGEFLISDKDTGWWRIPGGRNATFKFACKLHDKKQQLYRFTIKGSEDDISAGGSGA